MPDYDRELDITSYSCPMTFVRAKLLLESMALGEIAKIRLNAGEPLLNVPRSMTEHGQEILHLAPENEGDSDGVHILKVRKRV